MSFIGGGAEDWPEIDPDAIDFDGNNRLRSLVDEHRAQLETMLQGPFALAGVAGGRAHLVVDGEDRALAQVSASGRLMITQRNRSGQL